MSRDFFDSVEEIVGRAWALVEREKLERDRTGEYLVLRNIGISTSHFKRADGSTTPRPKGQHSIEKCFSMASAFPAPSRAKWLAPLAVSDGPAAKLRDTP